MIKQFGKVVEECDDEKNSGDVKDLLTGVIKQHKTTAFIFRKYLK